MQNVEQLDLYQPFTVKVCTKEMEDYLLKLLDSLGDVHGFTLKVRSLSCGPKDVKIYIGKEKATESIRGEGMFTSYVLER